MFHTPQLVVFNNNEPSKWNIPYVDSDCDAGLIVFVIKRPGRQQQLVVIIITTTTITTISIIIIIIVTIIISSSIFIIIVIIIVTSIRYILTKAVTWQHAIGVCGHSNTVSTVSALPCEQQ
ncbi:unnamed protein product [Polarella glacialis]|uniref:Uncharacterized protein n=1 Tax=Polarella glacialis TaxID=89957 RepID=A0A813LK27_POLGL|nr:unnamed protein product [Polarella glacialis]